MDQLTVRGFDQALARRIKQVAKAHGVSLNQEAVMVLRQGAGLESAARQSQRVGDSLNKLIGTWTHAETARFLESVRPLEKVDAEFWK
jgi:plasmid stability protein